MSYQSYSGNLLTFGAHIVYCLPEEPHLDSTAIQIGTQMGQSHVVECSMESFMHKDFRGYLSTFIYRLFHEDFSSAVGTNADTHVRPYQQLIETQEPGVSYCSICSV